MNGSRATSEAVCLFSSMQSCRFLEHDNSGYDIGAFQHASRNDSCDMMVFFGSSAYLKKAGWLKRMADTFDRLGDNLYGTHGNSGVARVGVSPHIRTTGFFVSPKLLNSYPQTVRSKCQRYEFEHGQDCLTSWCYRQGKRVYVVTWSGEYELPQWDSIPNGYHNGNQSDLLCGDRLTEPPYHPVP
jgi:hypothetical protein